jgi:SAM-dependent methyltransferase
MNENPQSPAVSSHYNSADGRYFRWQSSIGEFGGWANLTKFTDYITPDSRVLDFGCGGGYLLQNITCRQKLGIEVGEAARKEARSRNIDVVASTDEVRDEWADVIISNSALEHCLHPLQELEALRPKVVPGGRVVFVVPCESIRYKYKAGDINHHLYTWSPMCLGNLFTEAGFDVEECKPHLHLWPPFVYRSLARAGGRPLFDLGCRAWARLTYWGLIPNGVSLRVRVVARRPAVSTNL